MIVAGIDPGIKGAMVTLFEDGSVVVDRVPIEKRPKKKDRPAYAQWATSWTNAISFNAPDVFVMELVEARPGQGVVAMHSFGKFTGFALALAMASGKPVIEERPTIWKDKFGLIGFDKSFSIEVARRLVPAIIPELDRKLKGNTADVKHGIAEAALLAYYGVMTIKGR